MRGKVETLSSFGARLTNDRWGWDGTREDGSVVFIGWEENTQRDKEGNVLACQVWQEGNAANNKPGGLERARHIAQLESEEAVGYLLVATAVDVAATPRRIASIEERLYSVRLLRRVGGVDAVVVGFDSQANRLGSMPEDRIPEEEFGEVQETTRAQLVQARRGQGLFRSKVEFLEPCCRLTGIRDRAHLRASHIKPWRDCTNEERLDGHNGLLLAPHVDHLFDQGFISFEDDGFLKVSRVLDSAVLQAWGLPLEGRCGPFSERQAAYLVWHRERVFQG